MSYPKPKEDNMHAGNKLKYRKTVVVKKSSRQSHGAYKWAIQNMNSITKAIKANFSTIIFKNCQHKNLTPQLEKVSYSKQAIGDKV